MSWRTPLRSSARSGASVGGAGAIAPENLGHGVLGDQEGRHGRGAGTQLFEHDQLVPDVTVTATAQADPQKAHLRQGPEQTVIEGLGFVEGVHAVLWGHVQNELAHTFTQLGALRGVGDWVESVARGVGHAHHCSQCTIWAVSTRRPGLNSSPTVWATGIKAHCMTES